MSKRIGFDIENTDFELGDSISFDHEGERLMGKVVRVYNTRLVYHVLVDGNRYSIDVSSDNPRKETA